MNRFLVCLAVLFTALLSGRSSGQAVRIPNDSATIRIESLTTRKRLEEVQIKIKAGKVDDAYSELLSIIEEAGDDLVVADSTEQLIPASRVAHALIATLPEKILSSYRDRIQSAAQSLYDKALRTRDTKPIRELLSRYFHSRIAPDAIALLGEIQFERGAYATAESTWRRLFPGPGPVGWNVIVPPKDPASIEARIALAVVLQNEPNRAEEVLKRFRETFGTAKGTLNGKNGLFVDTLTEIQKQQTSQLLATSPHGSWVTTAGNAERNGRVDSQMPRIWPSGPTWRKPIRVSDARLKPGPNSVSRTSSFHPVILDGKAYIADPGRIYSYELMTGKSDIAFDIQSMQGRAANTNVDLRMPQQTEADFALCAAEGRLYARLGTPALWQSLGEDEKKFISKSFLVRMVPQSAGYLKADWYRTPPGPAGTCWQGTPIYDRGRLIAGTVRLDGGKLVHSLVCLDAGTSNLLWETPVVDSPVPTGDPKTRHELATIVDNLVIYNTQSGASVALDSETGKPAWAIRYPVMKPSGKALTLASSANHRDISPPISFDGIVCMAPTDSEQIFAVEAASGTRLWVKQSLRVESLLGISRYRLIATLAGPVRGIRAFDLRTGSNEFPNGWLNHDDPGLASLGRGLATDEQILWPTRSALYFLRPQDGRLARQPNLGQHGNLAYANGVLIVANPTEVLGYVIPETARPPRLRQPMPLESPPKRVIITSKEPIEAVNGPPPRPIPPRVVQEQTNAVPVSWANGVLPSDDWAGIWLIGPNRVSPVSRDGTIGEKVTPPFVPTRATSIGRHVALSDDYNIYRPDNGSLFHCQELNAECEAITSINVGFGILAVRIGDHHIACLDAPSLQVKWIVDASGRLGYWPYHQSAPSRFGPHLLVTSSGIICQRLDGHALVLEMTTGAVRYQLPTTMTPWKTPPLTLNNLCLIPGGPGQVTAFDPIDGERHWESEAPNESGLSGMSPSIRQVEDDVFVGIDRNHGVELQFLDVKTGRSKWRRPIFMTTMTPPLVGLDGNGSSIFATTSDSVMAIRKIDGRVLWRKPLPYASQGWNVASAIGGVIVSPRVARERENINTAYFQKSFWSFPDPKRTLGHLTTWVEEQFNRLATIFVLDQSNGQELRRIDLPIRGLGLDCRFHPTGGVVASAGNIYLLK